MPSTVRFTLTQLECKKESDGGNGGSEPYIWVTYFAVDGRNIARPEPVDTVTPSFDSFRAEFPQNVRAGQVMPITDGGNLTPFSLEVDLDTSFNMAGCIAVLLEEDETPNAAMIKGRIAYGKEVHKQLNLLVKKRLGNLNMNAITEAEIKVIKEAVEDRVVSTIRNALAFTQLFHNKDDLLGFTYVNLINEEIVTGALRFPEIFNGTDAASSSNRFVLSGRIRVSPVAPPVVEPCTPQRAAVKAKENEIKALQSRVLSLQLQLQSASPGAKAGIKADIEATNIEKHQAEAQLPPLKLALSECLKKNVHEIDPEVVVAVK
jgi:hypothetical protein